MGNIRFQTEEVFCLHRVDKRTLHYLHILCFFSLPLGKTKPINCLYSVTMESLFSEPHRTPGVFLLGSLDKLNCAMSHLFILITLHYFLYNVFFKMVRLM